MSARTRLVVGLVVLLAALAVAVAVLADDGDAVKRPGSADPAEDDPAWSCVLHGNRRCGGAS